MRPKPGMPAGVNPASPHKKNRRGWNTPCRQSGSQLCLLRLLDALSGVRFGTRGALAVRAFPIADATSLSVLGKGAFLLTALSVGAQERWASPYPANHAVELTRNHEDLYVLTTVGILLHKRYTLTP